MSPGVSSPGKNTSKDGYTRGPASNVERKVGSDSCLSPVRLASHQDLVTLEAGQARAGQRKMFFGEKYSH